MTNNPTFHSSTANLNMAKNYVPQPHDVLFFDVDGVLTNLNQNIVDDDLLLLLIKLIKKKFIVALNSGRSMTWLKQAVVQPLKKHIDQLSDNRLENFFVVGEKGGTWLNFDHTFGNGKTLLDESAVIPVELALMVQKLVESEFSQIMFCDLTKKAILTLEKDPTASITTFQMAQKKIIAKLKNILKHLKLSQKFEIDLTTIAIDIQSEILGKGYGVKKVLNYLNQNKIVTSQFFTFGDSSSDFEMAETLHELKKSVCHIHVGEIIPPPKTDYPIVITQHKYASGTREFFRNIIID